MNTFHLTYALIITHYEGGLTNINWETIVNQDYAVHCLYCAELDKILFLNDNIDVNAANEISKIKETIEALDFNIIESRCIKVIAPNDSEYDKEAVKKYFH